MPAPDPRRPIPTAAGTAGAFAAAVVVAAGRGERLGRPAKILLPVAGRPLLSHVLDAIDATTTIRDGILVVGTHTEASVRALLATGNWRKPWRLVRGGERRQDSVAHGCAAVPVIADVVVVHDAARPLAAPALFDRCATAARIHGAAIAAVPIADTLKRVVAGQIVATIPRDDLWAAQTPQAFRRALLLAALADPLAARQIFTDEAALLEALGQAVAIVPGSRTNLKVTLPEDIAVAEALLAARAAQPSGDGAGQ